MKIAFIGPDGAGKSTIAKEWAERYNMKLIENDYREPDKLTAFKALMHEEHVIFDRLFFPDHLVYSGLKGDSIPEDELWEWEQIRRTLHDEGLIYVYVDAPDELLRSRLEERGDDYITVDDLEFIKLAYELVLQIIPAPVIRIISHATGYTIEGVM